MNKTIKDFVRKKPSVKTVLEISNQSPKTGVDYSKKGISFSNFDDWRQIAGRANSPSPYSKFWRKLALSYPDNLAVQDLPSFLEIIDQGLLLAEQASARLLSLPSKKLPPVESLESLPEENKKQARFKSLLIKKKLLGDAGFARYNLSQVLRLQPDGSVSFPLEGGKVERHLISLSEKERREVFAAVASHRCQTLLGPATMIPILPTEEVAPRFYLLIDGQDVVKKLYLPELNWLDLDKE